MEKRKKIPLKKEETTESKTQIAEEIKSLDNLGSEAKAEEVIEKIAKAPVKEVEEKLAAWKPKTNLGKRVKAGEIKNIDEILDAGYKILEPEIVDYLLNLETELIAIGQSKGKFGGGKKRAWRQTQRKSAEGNVPTFGCMAIAGDKAGHVGLGSGKSGETLPAKEKAIRKAKLNIIKIKMGCGSFDCACNEPHSIPFKVKGKCGSSQIVLMPAPKGTGLVIEDECKKILAFAGVKDIYSKTFGQTRTKINLAKACFEALKKTKLFRK
jgi:small subunit ribosomal protein S5